MCIRDRGYARPGIWQGLAYPFSVSSSYFIVLATDRIGKRLIKLITGGETKMGMTMSEKILARHAGVDSVKPGDTVTCKVDWAVCHDMFFNVDGQDIYRQVEHIDHPERLSLIHI